MRPQGNIGKLIITKHIEVLEVSILVSGICVQIDVLDRIQLLDLALDIIGFPADTSEFNWKEFKYDEWDLNVSDIEKYVDKLYKLFDELLLSKPHLFVKN